MPAVLERFGACCDQLVGFVRLLCGDRDRDAARCEDYTFSAPSRSTYMAGLLTLAAVAADAAMVDHVIGVDACGEAAARRGRPAGRGRKGGGGLQGMSAPTQRDVEGSGGRFWYEGRI